VHKNKKPCTAMKRHQRTRIDLKILFKGKGTKKIDEVEKDTFSIEVTYFVLLFGDRYSIWQEEKY